MRVKEGLGCLLAEKQTTEEQKLLRIGFSITGYNMVIRATCTEEETDKGNICLVFDKTIDEYYTKTITDLEKKGVWIILKKYFKRVKQGDKL